MSRLLPLLQEALKEYVSEVRTTDRLVDSAVVLSAGEFGMVLHMQRMFRCAGRASGAGLPVLEINPRHALVRKLAEQATGETALTDEAGLLLDLARL